jgi:hypothetical protein
MSYVCTCPSICYTLEPSSAPLLLSAEPAADASADGANAMQQGARPKVQGTGSRHGAETTLPSALMHTATPKAALLCHSTVQPHAPYVVTSGPSPETTSKQMPSHLHDAVGTTAALQLVHHAAGCASVMQPPSISMAVPGFHAPAKKVASGMCTKRRRCTELRGAGIF